MKKQQVEQELEYGFPYHYVSSYKNNFSQAFVWGWSKNYTSALEFILDKIKESDEGIKTIYDIGCGDGRITKELHDAFDKIKVLGIDYSDKAINLAKAMSPNVAYKCLDINENNAIEKCDALTLIEVFEHIPLVFCQNFVKSLHALLNDEGLIFLTVPHKNVPVSYKHFQHFDLNSLKKYFEEFFLIEEVFYIQKSPLYMKLISKVVNNNFYVIKNDYINNLYYKFYKKYCFYSNEFDCERIYIKLRKK